jgi:hypothetical protein
MHFPYGISPASLTRWECFLRIRAVQEQRGSDVGRVALGRIIDAELQAIERATLAEEQRPVFTRRSGFR